MMHATHESCIAAAVDALNDARRLLNAEISAYPAPISGCDAQFNHLLAQRQRVILALATLDEIPFVPTPRQPTEGVRVESR